MAFAATQSQSLAGQRLAFASSSSRRTSSKARFVTKAAIELKPPPYPLDALEPKISKSTLEYHWGKHHAAYVTNLNNQIKDSELDNKSLEEIVVATWNNGSPTPAFNNAAQVWNHTFYWENIAPNGGGAPSGAVAEAINKAFGSYDDFKTQFKAAGATQFGSGWAWLVALKDGSVAIRKTANAETPFTTEGETPILTMDVWEHAYYLDYQNKRPDYMTTFVEELIDWEAVAARYAAATA